jgi:hypothetical protein
MGGYAFEDPARAEPQAEERAAMQGCKPLLALAGKLPGMQWGSHWQQGPHQLHLGSMTWQQRVGVLLEFMGLCLPRVMWRLALKKQHTRQDLTGTLGMHLFKYYSSGAAGCVLLDRQRLGRCGSVLVLLGSRGHRGRYLGIRLGHCLVPAASGAAPAAAARRVPVVLLWHQLMALAWRGLPRDAQTRRALHVPELCPTQHALCGCCSHVGWGSDLENSQHRLATAAARQLRFTKVSMPRVAAHLKTLEAEVKLAACSSKAAAAAMVDTVASQLAAQLAAMSLMQQQEQEQGQGGSSPVPRRTQIQISPLLTRRARQQQEQQQQLVEPVEQQQQQEQEVGQGAAPAPARPPPPAGVHRLNSRMQVDVGPGGQLQQLQPLPARSTVQHAAAAARHAKAAARCPDAAAALHVQQQARAAAAAAAAAKRQQRESRRQQDWGNTPSSSSSSSTQPSSSSRQQQAACSSAPSTTPP